MILCAAREPGLYVLNLSELFGEHRFGKAEVVLTELEIRKLQVIINGRFDASESYKLVMVGKKRA